MSEPVRRIVRLSGRAGLYRWSWRVLIGEDRLSNAEIARRLGIHRSNLGRMRQAACGYAPTRRLARMAARYVA